MFYTPLIILQFYCITIIESCQYIFYYTIIFNYYAICTILFIVNFWLQSYFFYFFHSLSPLAIFYLILLLTLTECLLQLYYSIKYSCWQSQMRFLHYKNLLSVLQCLADSFRRHRVREFSLLYRFSHHFCRCFCH